MSKDNNNNQNIPNKKEPGHRGGRPGGEKEVMNQLEKDIKIILRNIMFLVKIVLRRYLAKISEMVENKLIFKTI